MAAAIFPTIYPRGREKRGRAVLGFPRLAPVAQDTARTRLPGGAWPPQAGVRPVRQENKLLIPAAFSPVR
jgi:hypothetical protein